MIVKVKIDQQQYDVEIVDINARPVIAKIGSEVFEVHPAEMEARSQPVSAAALSSVVAAPAPVPTPAPTAAPPPPVSSGGGKVITAPIPGTIVEIFVSPGDRVEAGKELCSLEAMKMKNAIRATRSGTISAVHVTVGQQVRHGQPLLEFGD